MPLISIIIPVFNREFLVEETLISIINQSFTNWECIVVDDNSSDNTFSVLKKYQEIDFRIKVLKRPDSFKKGANSCRNYGFKLAKGKYIKWFDSDDLMKPNHLEIAIENLISHDLDFVITDCINFEHSTNLALNKPYDFNRKDSEINLENFVLNKIGWITNDFLGKKEILNHLSFNENITDGDEYNFFIKFLHHSKNGLFIDEVLSLRRIHEGSISIINRKGDFDLILAKIHYHNANDLRFYNNKKMIRWFLSQYMYCAYKIAINKKKIPNLINAIGLICIYYSIYRAMLFLGGLISSYIFKKGFKIIQLARK